MAMHDRLRRHLRRWLPPLMVVLLCVAGFARLVGRSGAHLISYPTHLDADAVVHLWQYWWADLATREGTSPFISAMATWPVEMDMRTVWGGHLDLVLGIPLVRAFGLAGGANAVLLLLLVASGLGVYLLALGVTGRRWPAAVAGMLYVTSPVVLREAIEGRAEELCFGFVAVALLFGGRWLTAGRTRDLVLTGGAVMLASLGYIVTPMLTAFLVLALGLGYASLYLVRRWRGTPPALPSRRVIAVRSVLLVVTAALVTMPAVWSGARRVGTEWATDLHASADARPAAQVEEWRERSVQGAVPPDEMFSPLPAGQPAWTGLLLPVLGAVAMHGMALGPWLATGDRTLTLPYYVLHDVVPFFLRFHWPYRFLLLGDICLAVLVAIGLRRGTTVAVLTLRWCLRRVGCSWPVGHLRGRLVIALVVLAVIQVISLFPLPVGLLNTVPLAYQGLAGQEDLSGVIEVVPTTHPAVDPCLAQLHHRAPYCCLGLPEHLVPEELTRLMYRDVALDYLVRARATGPPPLPKGGGVWGSSLIELGFSHVVLQADDLHAPEFVEARGNLSRLLGQPLFHEQVGERGAVEIYLLPLPGGKPDDPGPPAYRDIPGPARPAGVLRLRTGGGGGSHLPPGVPARWPAARQRAGGCLLPRVEELVDGPRAVARGQPRGHHHAPPPDRLRGGVLPGQLHGGLPRPAADCPVRSGGGQQRGAAPHRRRGLLGRGPAGPGHRPGPRTGRVCRRGVVPGAPLPRVLDGGAYENLPGPWLPLFTLALVRLLRPWRPLLTGRWTGRTADRAAMASLAGVSLWLFALTSWFNGLVLAFYAGVALLVVGVVATRRVLVRVCWALAGLAGGGVAVVLSARALLPIVQTSADDVPLRFSTLNAPFLAMTWKRDATLSELFAHDTLWLNHHLLVTVGLLALLGLSRRWGRWTLLAALPFLVDFALPERWFEDTRLMIPEAWGLVHTAAGWIVGEAQRRLFPVHLLLSLAAGHGLAWAIERVGRWRGPRAARAVPVVALAAWLIESVVAGPVRLPVYSFRPDVAGSSEFLASAPAGAVIDVPLRYDGPKAEIKATQSWYIFQQTVHHQPVMAAVGSRLSFAEMGLPVRDPLLDRIQQVLDGRRVTPLDGWTPDSLRAAGYRWIVLHGPRIDHKVRQPLATTLQEVVGDPAWIGRDQMVFRIPDAGEGEGEGDGRATR